MNVIKKRTTSNSFYYVVQTRPGYFPSNISNEIVTDFKRGLITHETTLSAVKRSNSNKKRHHKINSTRNQLSQNQLATDYHCSITFNGQYIPKHVSHNKREEKSKSTQINQHRYHHHLPTVYSPLTKSSVNKISYFNRTVVLPSAKASHFDYHIKSSKLIENVLYLNRYMTDI